MQKMNLKSEIEGILWEYRGCCLDKKVAIKQTTKLKANKLLSLFKRKIGEIEKDLSNITQQQFDMAIGDSKDFERGFKQGFEVCWNKMLDKYEAITKLEESCKK